MISNCVYDFTLEDRGEQFDKWVHTHFDSNDARQRTPMHYHRQRVIRTLGQELERQNCSRIRIGETKRRQVEEVLKLMKLTSQPDSLRRSK